MVTFCYTICINLFTICLNLFTIHFNLLTFLYYNLSTFCLHFCFINCLQFAYKLVKCTWLFLNVLFTICLFLFTFPGWYYIEKLTDGQKGWVPISSTREIESNHIRARNFKQRHAFLKLLTSMDPLDSDLLNNNGQLTNRYSYYDD